MGRKALFMVVAAAFIISCSRTPEVSIKKLTLVYSGNIGGRKNPCGCKPPMGGFARRSTIIDAVRDQYDNMLIVDSGAILYPGLFLSPPYNYPLRIDGRVSAQAVSMIGIDALNVSSFDLANSVDSLLATGKDNSLPLFSANLIWKDSGKLVFPPDTITKKGNLRIGIFGVMADNFMGTPLFTADSPLAVLDMMDAAKQEVSRLGAECDIVVALAYMGKDEVNRLLENVSGIAVLVHSHNGYHNPSSDPVAFAPYTKGKTIVVRCPDGGRVLGYLELVVVNGSTDFTEIEDNPYKIQDEEEFIQEKLKTGSTFVNRFVELSPAVKSDTTVQTVLDSVDGVIKAYKDSLHIQ